VTSERFIEVEQALGQFGRLVDDVAAGSEPVSLTKHGQPVAVLVGREEWEALKAMVRAKAREELRRRLTQVRQRVSDSRLDPATVDEAIAPA